MLADTLIQHEDVIDVCTNSGGGANGIWSWTVNNELEDAGYEMEWYGGSSTGALVSFLRAKGLREEGDKLYRLTYEQNAKNIFEPGIAAIKGSKLDINWLKAIPAIFRLRKVKSLMTNKGLYDTLLALQKAKPEFTKPMFFNTTDLTSGRAVQHSSEDFKGRDEALCMAITASTSMPGIMPWWEFDDYKAAVDGGTVRGLPIDQMFERMERGKAYRFWNIMCNPIDMMPAIELKNAAQIIGRSAGVMLNSNLVSALKRTQDKNEVSKVIWPISDKLEAMGLLDLATELRDKLGYKNMPINNLIYSGSRGVFDFTMESYYEQIETGKKDVKNYLTPV